MSSTEVTVRFNAVEKTYDGRINVVERMDLDIYQGEFLTLLGPSGSGKTTTLLMLAGFEEPTAGDIHMNGQSLRNVPPFRRNMGVVFQNYALFPHKTVFQNVAFPLVQRKISKPAIAEQVGAALRMVELEGYGDRRPNQLSGGQQQRVALARALVFEPNLLLMDEPLGALDKKLREQMQIEIKHLHEVLGTTVVYVTHDQGEALTMSDRVAVMDDGRIQQIGTPQEIYERPGNSFVANFIGENNNLDGTVERVDRDHCEVRLASGDLVVARRIGVSEVGADDGADAVGSGGGGGVHCASHESDAASSASVFPVPVGDSNNALCSSRSASRQSRRRCRGGGDCRRYSKES